MDEGVSPISMHTHSRKNTEYYKQEFPEHQEASR